MSAQNESESGASRGAKTQANDPTLADTRHARQLDATLDGASNQTTGPETAGTAATAYASGAMTVE